MANRKAKTTRTGVADHEHLLRSIKCVISGRMANRKAKTTRPGVADHEHLLRAIKCVISGMTTRATAEKYGIPRQSLARYVEKFVAEISDIADKPDEELMEVVRYVAPYSTHQLIFDTEQENILADYVIKCCKHNYKLSKTELKQLAYQFAVRLNIKCPTDWADSEMASWEWYNGFLLRHKNLSFCNPKDLNKNSEKQQNHICDDYDENITSPEPSTSFASGLPHDECCDSSYAVLLTDVESHGGLVASSDKNFSNHKETIITSPESLVVKEEDE